MADPVIINNNIGNVILSDAEFKDDALTFAGGTYPRTIAEGTILARDSVSGLLIPFVIGGSTNDDGIPKTVLTYDVVAAAAGDEQVRSMISGKVRTELLIEDGDGDGSNLTDAIFDSLRDYGIIPVNVKELNIADNQ